MMMKRATGLALAAKRTPVVAKRASVVVKASEPEPVAQSNKEFLLSLPGVSAPFEDVFDPAGFTEKATKNEIRRWRESEIVHGRVAMLAALGFVVGEQLEDFPAFMNFDGSITGPAIYHYQQVRQGFTEPLLIAIGVAEAYRVAIGWSFPVGSGFNSLKEDYSLGSLGFDPLGLGPTDPAELKIMQTKEINNGRLAMIAIAGFVAQELVDHKEVFEHLFVESADEVIKELDDLQRDVGIPETPVPFPGF